MLTGDKKEINFLGMIGKSFHLLLFFLDENVFPEFCAITQEWVNNFAKGLHVLQG